MDDEQKCATANTMLARMVTDYRSDMAKWARSHNEADPKHTDAALIARHMHDLIRAQPEISAWLLAVAIQRLGDP